MPKRRAKPRDIVARSIVLTDGDDSPMILMGVSKSPPSASITLMGPKGRVIELMCDPEGGLCVSLTDESAKLVAGMSIMPSDKSDKLALFLYDHPTGTRTEIGSSGIGYSSPDGQHHLTLTHKGQEVWTTKNKTAKKKRTPKAG